MDGALILDKAEGISSHSAVLAVRRLLSEPRIGHLGTLDPFACGVLVLLLGKATRLARFYRDRDKTYRGTIRFGYSTDSYDSTGTPTSPDRKPTLDEDELRRLFGEFVGTQLQQPPALSAKKIGGVRAYRLARRGQMPALNAVSVTIHELELLSIDGPFVGIRVRASSGTYVRSLAHELGMRMRVGAHLAQLRRTAVGEFVEAAAVSLEQLETRKQQGVVPLIPMETLLPEFPALALPSFLADLVSNGNPVALEGSEQWVRLLDASGTLRGIAERTSDGLYHPLVVFPTSPCQQPAGRVANSGRNLP